MVNMKKMVAQAAALLGRRSARCLTKAQRVSRARRAAQLRWERHRKRGNLADENSGPKP
jgi:hypothetical protein